MIKATCKICGFEKNFEDKHIGKTFKCPNCTTPVKIEVHQILEELKKEVIEEKQDPIPVTNKDSKSKISNIVKFSILGLFISIIFIVFLYKKGSNNNTSYTIADTIINSNTVTPDEYWKSKEDNTSIQYEIGYYKKKYSGSDHGIIYENSEATTTANQYLYDDVVIKIEKVVNGAGFLSYVNSSNIQSYGWIKMEELIKTEDPNTVDIDIVDAKDQYIKYYNAILERDKSGIYNIFSDIFENYMGKTNLSKDKVYDDASKYMDRWKLISEDLNDFTKFSKNKFSYSKRITVVKVDDETIERIFDIEGVIGFDSEMKINYLNDTKTTRIN